MPIKHLIGNMYFLVGVLLTRRVSHVELLVWDRYKNMAGLNLLMGSQAFPHGNWNPNGNTYINKRKKNLLPSFLLK
jgi:hypothetical protein